MTHGPARRDAPLVAGVALAVRLLVVVWAGTRFGPAADGTYYDIVARRIADGHGYTWLWPDGAVTYAAHYPVGYPALVALAYGLAGASPSVAMVVNALVGTAGAWATYDLLSAATNRRLALAGGLVAALHPALVPYTAAIMTEGVTASLLVLAAAFAERARSGVRTRTWVVACGFAMGAATLVRPQSLALAPVLGWLAVRGELRVRITTAAVVTALALATCGPWTARNCVRMKRCSLVSVNGGWNLAIGAQTTNGAWQEIRVPDACKEVFAEAAKDTCFGRAAMASIFAAPGAWLARAPAKVRVTFDYFGAAPYYLHASNAARFDERAKVALGTVETIIARALLAAALVATARAPRPDAPRRRLRLALVSLGLVACFTAPGALAYLACAASLAVLGRGYLERAPVLLGATAAVIGATALTHAVFFGAGRYGLVVVPFVTALAFVRPEPSSSSVR